MLFSINTILLKAFQVSPKVRKARSHEYPPASLPPSLSLSVPRSLSRGLTPLSHSLLSASSLPSSLPPSLVVSVCSHSLSLVLPDGSLTFPSLPPLSLCLSHLLSLSLVVSLSQSRRLLLSQLLSLSAFGRSMSLSLVGCLAPSFQEYLFHVLSLLPLSSRSPPHAMPLLSLFPALSHLFSFCHSWSLSHSFSISLPYSLSPSLLIYCLFRSSL